jgi:flagellar biosynthetic protein FliP
MKRLILAGVLVLTCASTALAQDAPAAAALPPAAPADAGGAPAGTAAAPAANTTQPSAAVPAAAVPAAPSSTTTSTAALPRPRSRPVTPTLKPAAAATSTPSNLAVNINGVGALSAPLQIVVLLTLLTFVPAALVMMTSFTRIAIVFHFLRQALGTQEMPSNQMLIGLTLFLTAFIMAPTASRINEAAIQPAIGGQMDVSTAIEQGAPPLRDFMLRQTREADLALFVDLSGSERPTRTEDLPMRVVIPAFAISELKTGFQMGFFLFVPFLLVDLVVSTTLLSMGMMQLPPMMISLPFKVLLFVMIDGWNLLVGSLVRSFL